MHPSLLYAYSRPNPPDPLHPYPPFEQWKKVYDSLQDQQQKINKDTAREVRRSDVRFHNFATLDKAKKEFSLRVAIFRSQKENPFLPKPQGL